MNNVDWDGLIPTALEAALMSADVYDAKEKNGIKSGKVKKRDVKTIGRGWVMYDVETGSEGLKMAIYVRGDEKYSNYTGDMEYVVANAGTTWYDLNDWDNNKEQLNGNSTDMKESIDKSEKFAKLNQCYEITFVGHSKGGAEAIANAISVKDKWVGAKINAITFNSAKLELEKNNLNKKIMNKNTVNYVVKKEILSTLLGENEVGKTVYLATQHNGPNGNDDPNSAIKNHLMSSVIKALKEDGYS